MLPALRHSLDALPRAGWHVPGDADGTAWLRQVLAAVQPWQADFPGLHRRHVTIVPTVRKRADLGVADASAP